MAISFLAGSSRPGGRSAMTALSSALLAPSDRSAQALALQGALGVLSRL